MFLVCQNDSIRILPQFGSVKFFYIIKSMKLTKLGCYLLVFRANLRAFSYIFTSNNIYNGHMCVWKSHLEPRKKLIFLPQNQPWGGGFGWFWWFHGRELSIFGLKMEYFKVFLVYDIWKSLIGNFKYIWQILNPPGGGFGRF